jgi:predicted nucleic acid-binding protein
MYMSVMSLTEMRVGLGLMPPGKRRNAIAHWLERSLIPHFQNRILPVTSEIAIECGNILAAAKSAGHTPDPLDALIAATARVNGFSVLTLNRKHFSALQIPLVDLERPL